MVISFMVSPLPPSSLAQLLVCPVCHGRLLEQAKTVDCLDCGRRYPIEDGLPILLPARAEDAGVR
jgi:uncharacterized protein YbaR (Trm112 family)